MKNHIKGLWYIFAAAIVLSTVSCDNFRQNVDIELPEFDPEIVVECYLEEGKPFRLLLTETVSYFEEFTAFPSIKGATVTISYGNETVTLLEAPPLTDSIASLFPDSLFAGAPLPEFVPFFNEDFTKIYNYASFIPCPTGSNETFTLRIDDNNGRVLTAKTSFLQKTPIKSLEAIFDNAGESAYTLIKFDDNGNNVDFYRPQIHLTTTIGNQPDLDFTVDDGRFLNGEEIVFGTAYNYEAGDTLIGTLYHIDKFYHDYLESVNDAISSNGNPFAQPGRIIDNIDNGLGIFTALTFDRDTLIIPN